MFWDSSALVPLLLPDPRSASLSGAAVSDREFTIWWGAPLECQSAVYRRHREAPLPKGGLERAFIRLRELVEDADMISPTNELRGRAGRLLALHPLRAADALQLAAALVWCEEQPAGETFACLDGRLRDAAAREGFTLLPDSL